MTEHRPSPQPRPDPPEPAPGSVLEPGHLVSIRDVPEDWVEAEDQAPTAGSSATRTARRRKRSPIPIRREGAFVANAVAAAAGFVSASVWYLVDVLDLYRGPWIPVAVAVAIAGAVRLTSRTNPAHRAVASTLAYLLVLLIVLILLTHRDLVTIYGSIDDYRTYEQSLVRSRLQDPLHLAAYGIGGIVAAIIPFVGERRR